ncbi:MAG: XylR family transcriptional regulator [Planctomycetota bacterium]
MNSGKTKFNITQLKEWKANGIITCEFDNIGELLSLKTPTIISPHTWRDFSKMPRIIPDSARVGQIAADYLLARGFKRYAFCGFDNMPWSMERCENFAKRVKKAGFEFFLYRQPKSLIDRSWEKEQYILADWLKSLDKPLGLMACNDDRAQQILEASKIAGIRLPEEIAILGANNDTMICDLVTPQLSSIAFDTERAGYKVAELLNRLMTSKEASQLDYIIKVQPTHIVSRRSTDTIAIEDYELARAVRFIRQNAKKLIQVNDVVNNVGISRSSLDRRFKKILGYSISREIRNARIELICRMLLETDMTIKQIALTLGFPNPDHIARYFRQEKGMNLLEYKKTWSNINKSE